MSKPLDPLRTAAAAISTGLTKPKCEEGKAALGLPSPTERDTAGILDLVVLHGDHDKLQPGVAKKAPTADCIVFVAVRDGAHVRIILLLVELKDGEWGATNVRGKFTTSWMHAIALLGQANLHHHRAGLRKLGGHGKKAEDRIALAKPIRACGGLAPEKMAASVPLMQILQKVL